MADVYINQKISDRERREKIFDGKIFLYSGLQSCVKLCDHAWQILQESFDSAAPETSFRELPVEEFVRRAEVAKNKFTNGQRSKELIREYVLELGSNPEDYYFDVPRVRIVPHFDYLHAGVSYAYAAHRDTWYGGPRYQINQWMPVRAITPDQTMSLYPAYFRKPVKNSSKDFDLAHWVSSERNKAVKNIVKEDRVHPLPLEEIDSSAEVRFAGNSADLMVFSGTHLHATVPNRTQVTRFSVDFRLFHVEEVSGKGGLREPSNIDCEAKSEDYGMNSCFHLGDFAPFRKMK